MACQAVVPRRSVPLGSFSLRHVRAATMQLAPSSAGRLDVSYHLLGIRQNPTRGTSTGPPSFSFSSTAVHMSWVRPQECTQQTSTTPTNTLYTHLELTLPSRYALPPITFPDEHTTFRTPGVSLIRFSCIGVRKKI
eukprot:GHVT01005753.1.p1 GENE.GHVT01005753.1~~GHVT01005753.1.p1  ORF type:complete len:136 (+),score=7.42 GHVT01005753.1:360-767(+)